MVMSQSDIEQELSKVLAPLVDRPAGYARLGKGDNSGDIMSNIESRMAYIFDTNVGAEAKLAPEIFISAINDPQIAGRRVWLAYPRYQPNILHVMGLDPGEGMLASGGTSLNEQRTAAMQYPDVGKILTFRLSAMTPPSLNIRVEATAYYDLDGVWRWFGGDNLDEDFTASVAALSGEHQLAVVYLDATTNELGFVLSDPVTGDEEDKNFFDPTSLEDMTFDAGWILCEAVHLYDGQTEIVEADIYRTWSARVIYPTPGAGGTGGGGTVETVVAGDGIVVNDTDPANPIVSNDGVITIVAGDNITVDDTDPQHPIVAASGSGIATLTPPVFADFTAVNQGGATMTSTSKAIHIYAPPTGGVNQRILKKTAPATPYVLTAGFMFHLPNTTDYPNVGVLWRENSSGKLMTANVLNDLVSNNAGLGFSYYDSETSYDSNYRATLLIGAGLPSIVWYRLEDDGTDRTVSYSIDGVFWMELFSGDRTDFLTADEIGFSVDASQNAIGVAGTLVSWLEE